MLIFVPDSLLINWHASNFATLLRCVQFCKPWLPCITHLAFFCKTSAYKYAITFFFLKSCLPFLQLTGKGFPRFLDLFSLAGWNATLGFCRDVSSQAHALFCCFSDSFGLSIRWVGSLSNHGPCLLAESTKDPCEKTNFSGPKTCIFGCSCTIASVFYERKLVLIEMDP